MASLWHCWQFVFHPIPVPSGGVEKTGASSCSWRVFPHQPCPVISGIFNPAMSNFVPPLCSVFSIARLLSAVAGQSDCSDATCPCVQRPAPRTYLAARCLGMSHRPSPISTRQGFEDGGLGVEYLNPASVASSWGFSSIDRRAVKGLSRIRVLSKKDAFRTKFEGFSRMKVALLATAAASALTHLGP
jgi:hypothetical protein